MRTGKLEWGAEDMAANGVNLDALIPREDFAAPTTPYKGTPMGTIGMGMLKEDFFAQSLRKPDFQRETSNWTPQKIVAMSPFANPTRGR